MNFSKIKKYLKYKYLFYFSIIVFLAMVISSTFTGTFNMLFDHVTVGQDFYQIPNGAYSFLKGEGLEGAKIPGIERYTDCCDVNKNVYHPLLTLMIGIPLTLFSPQVTYYIWVGVHIIFAAVTLFFLWHNFRSHKFIFLALSIFLLNSYNYYELQHAQYHFLFSFFTMLFVYEVSKNGDGYKAGLWLFLSLLVKPIGILWLLPLVIYRKWKTLLLGSGLFFIFTAPFFLLPQGKYYFTNIITNLSYKYAAYNLMALTHIVNINLKYFSLLSYIIAALLLIYQILKRPSMYKVIFLWIAYQLIFYSGVYHYYYAIFAYLFALGILLNEIYLNFLERYAILLLTLPTPIIIFHLAGYPKLLPPAQISMVSLWSITLLVIFCIGLIIQKPYRVAH